VRSSGRPVAQIARELGLDDATLGKWVRDERRNSKLTHPAPGPDDAEMQENRRLRKRIAELEKEREILKRAVVFWVKESNE
jgi:transposase